jgi:predicted transcriptional regulator
MTLDAYLKEAGESEGDFAERAGIGKATVYRIKKNGARSAAVIQKVVDATAGKVTVGDLVSVATKKKRRAA